MYLLNEIFRAFTTNSPGSTQSVTLFSIQSTQFVIPKFTHQTVKSTSLNKRGEWRCKTLHIKRNTQ